MSLPSYSFSAKAIVSPRKAELNTNTMADGESKRRSTSDCITVMHYATMDAMKAITLRNVPPHVARQIERKAREDKTSLNRAVIALLEEKSSRPRNGESKTPRRDLSFLVGM